MFWNRAACGVLAAAAVMVVSLVDADRACGQMVLYAETFDNRIEDPAAPGSGLMVGADAFGNRADFTTPHDWAGGYADISGSGWSVMDSFLDYQSNLPTPSAGPLVTGGFIGANDSFGDVNGDTWVNALDWSSTDGALGMHTSGPGSSMVARSQTVFELASSTSGALALMFDAEAYAIRVPEWDLADRMTMRLMRQADHSTEAELVSPWFLSSTAATTYASQIAAAPELAYRVVEDAGMATWFWIDGNAGQNSARRITSGPMEMSLDAGAYRLEFELKRSERFFGADLGYHLGLAADNVVVGFLAPGDTEGDFDIDNDDVFGILGADLFNKGAVGATWAEGDFDFDGDVDNDDIFLILATGLFGLGDYALGGVGATGGWPASSGGSAATAAAVVPEPGTAAAVVLSVIAGACRRRRA